LTEVFPTTVELGLIEVGARALEAGTPLELPAQPYEQVIEGRSHSAVFEIRAVPIDDSMVVTYSDVTERERAAAAPR